MNTQEYESQERRRFHLECVALESLPYQDKLDARADYVELMRDPFRLDMAVDNILCGNFGHGAMLAGLAVVASPRMNRVAALGVMVAACECRCPGDKAIQAWRGLTSDEQSAADGSIGDAIDNHIKECEVQE